MNPAVRRAAVGCALSPGMRHACPGEKGVEVFCSTAQPLRIERGRTILEECGRFVVKVEGAAVQGNGAYRSEKANHGPVLADALQSVIGGCIEPWATQRAGVAINLCWQTKKESPPPPGGGPSQPR